MEDQELSILQHTFCVNNGRIPISSIFFLEVVGMLVFFFEYLSLTALDPTIVSIILGAHIMLVYTGDIALGQYRLHMERNAMQEKYFLGIRLLQHKLPEPEHNLQKIALKVLVMCIILSGIAIVIQYM